MFAGLALAAASASAALAVPAGPAGPVGPATPPPSHGHHAKPAPHAGVRKPGHRAVDVRAVQLRLQALHYDPGPANGVYGDFTRYAVWAFQQVNGMAPTGKLDNRLLRSLAHPKQPRPLTADRSRNRVDVSIQRQVLVVYRGGKVALISHISTGSGRHYCDAGHCGIARTPRGDFRVTRRLPGWHRSPLGYMYRPLYFHLGYAIHGSLNVPRRPASHGCVRVPMHTADLVPGLVRNGEPVHVR